MISDFDRRKISDLSLFLDKCHYSGRVKMAAFLVSRKNRIVAYGNNSISLNCEVKLMESLTGKKLSFRKKRTRIGTIHAEMACFASLGFSQKYIRGTTLYVRGVSLCNNSLKSKPCPTCLKLASFLGVKRIVYSNKGNEIVEEIL